MRTTDLLAARTASHKFIDRIRSAYIAQSVSKCRSHGLAQTLIGDRLVDAKVAKLLGVERDLQVGELELRVAHY
jgi:hypothetical protein